MYFIIIVLEQLISKRLPGESTQIFVIHILRVCTNIMFMGMRRGLLQTLSRSTDTGWQYIVTTVFFSTPGSTSPTCVKYQYTNHNNRLFIWIIIIIITKSMSTIDYWKNSII